MQRTQAVHGLLGLRHVGLLLAMAVCRRKGWDADGHVLTRPGPAPLDPCPSREHKAGARRDASHAIALHDLDAAFENQDKFIKVRRLRATGWAETRCMMRHKKFLTCMADVPGKPLRSEL